MDLAPIYVPTRSRFPRVPAPTELIPGKVIQTENANHQDFVILFTRKRLGAWLLAHVP